jgi:DNA-binding transcriptional ArsR family regulator
MATSAKKRSSTKRDAKSKTHSLLAHPLRARIWTMLSNGEYSPNGLAQELDAPIGNVSYHVRILSEANVIRQTNVIPRRGAVEHYYKAVKADRLPARFLLTKQQSDEFLKQLHELVDRTVKQAEASGQEPQVEIALAAFPHEMQSASEAEQEQTAIAA